MKFQKMHLTAAILLIAAILAGCGIFAPVQATPTPTATFVPTLTPAGMMTFTFRGVDYEEGKNIWTFFANGCDVPIYSEEFECGITVGPNSTLHVHDRFGSYIYQNGYVRGGPDRIPGWGVSSAASATACVAEYAGLDVISDSVLKGKNYFQPVGSGGSDACADLTWIWESASGKSVDDVHITNSGTLTTTIHIAGGNALIHLWVTRP